MVVRLASDRAVSPVVGAVLLVAIVLLLSALTAGVFLDLAREREPQPTVTLALESEDSVVGQRWLVHRQGATLDGGDLRIRGVADPDAAAGSRLVSGTRQPVWPVAETVTVVWEGEQGTTYVLREFAVDPDELYPAPDEGCSWVDSESNGGTDQVKVEDLVVNCDVETDEIVEVFDGGTVIGDVVSRSKGLDADSAEIYGSVEAEKVANAQSTTVSGSVVSLGEDAKVDDATVGSALVGEKVVEAVNGSTVGGDVVSHTRDVKVFDSVVSGSVTADGTVKLDNATVDGDVYTDPADFDCVDSEVDGRDCSSYTPKDPDEY